MNTPRGGSARRPGGSKSKSKKKPSQQRIPTAQQASAKSNRSSKSAKSVASNRSTAPSEPNGSAGRPVSRKHASGSRLFKQQISSFDVAQQNLVQALEAWHGLLSSQATQFQKPHMQPTLSLPAKFSTQLGGVDRIGIEEVQKQQQLRSVEQKQLEEVSVVKPLVPGTVFQAEETLFEIKSKFLKEMEQAVELMGHALESSEILSSVSWLEKRELFERYCNEFELAESICIPLSHTANADVVKTHILALKHRPFLE
mmetsp:Transcript_22397/g.43929  ORF Transcript_22397/g.43929 Transcript_22397/m.43929 type:complete len:256 (+) Transcript_22397:62-829(+)